MKKKGEPELVSRGAKVKKIRKQLGLSQEILAILFNMDANTVRAIEIGYHHSTSSILPITRAFSLDWSDFNNPNSPAPIVDEGIIEAMIVERKKTDSRLKNVKTPKPSAVTFIIHILPKTDFLKTKRSLKEIRDYIKLEYGVTLHQKTLRSALETGIEAKIIEKEGEGKSKENGVKYCIDPTWLRKNLL